MITIQINGEPIELHDAQTIADLLRERRLDRAACAVEVNRKVVPKRLHEDHQLHDGDAIEIVALVGGG